MKRLFCCFGDSFVLFWGVIFGVVEFCGARDIIYTHALVLVSFCGMLKSDLEEDIKIDSHER